MSFDDSAFFELIITEHSCYNKKGIFIESKEIRMSKRAKRTRKKKKGYSLEVIGIILIFISILAIGEFGFVGRFFANIIRFFVGETFQLFSAFGIIEEDFTALSKAQKNYVKSQIVPCDYWYTVKIANDIHVDFNSMPKKVENLIGEFLENDVQYEQTM